MTNEQKEYLKSLIWNTMDFCGSVVHTVREFCQENNLDVNSSEVNDTVFEAQMSYGEFHS